MLFYLKALVIKKGKLKKPLALHLIPFFLIWIFISVPISIHLSWRYFDGLASFYATYADIFNLVENAYFLVYCVLAKRLATRIMDASKTYYSSLSTINLSWFQHAITGFVILIISDSALSIYELNYEVLAWNVGILIAFGYFVLFVFLGYRGTFQANIFFPQSQDEMRVEDTDSHLLDSEVKAVNKKQISHLQSLDETQIQELKDRLKEILRTKKPYLNEDLSLTDLADELGITNKQLSELLNQHLNINFYTLINAYRIEEFKSRIAGIDKDKFTLLGIAYDCGFKSKASFNRVFKQKMGMTPSKYRNDQIKEH